LLVFEIVGIEIEKRGAEKIGTMQAFAYKLWIMRRRRCVAANVLNPGGSDDPVRLKVARQAGRTS